ncbi:MAG: GNAT family N-acetyltransferase [Dehalococcoidia bacterium]|nr:GNAT family N-acetyltransferase [Dehalococcoidia bacterium]
MTQGDSITIRLQDAVAAADVGALQPLYDAAFPPHLRAPWEELAAEIADGAVLWWVVRDGARAIGFAEGRPMGDGVPLFLEYIAIDPAGRSRGTGSQLMVAVTADPVALAGVILEIGPLDEGDAEQRHEAARRHAFYQRLGAVEVPCAAGYRVPGGPGALHRLSLRWLPGRPAVGAPAGARLRAILHAIATGGYGLDPASSEYAALTGGQTC